MPAHRQERVHWYAPTQPLSSSTTRERVTKTYDLLVKGGTVVDPSQGLNKVRDVAFRDGKVAAISEDVTASEAREVVDARGLLVAPGLIDLHVHAFWGASEYGMDPDYGNVANGVTTAVDAGSAGARTFPAFRRYVIDRCDTRLFALLNLSSKGMLWPGRAGELTDLRWVDVEETVAVGSANRDVVLGVKARVSRPYAGDNDVESLKRALGCAEGLGGFVMIHVKDTVTPLEELAAMLRPGDVVTHAFHGKADGLLDDRDGVVDGLRDAQQRGVIFDVGHGSGSFSFDVAEKAMAQGFLPDNISSDLYHTNVEGPVFDLLTVLSKFMYLGMSVYDVVQRCTETAARAIGMDGKLGTLTPGAEGDAVVMALEEGEFALSDAGRRRTVKAKQRLGHVLTVKGGRRYRPWDRAGG